MSYIIDTLMGVVMAAASFCPWFLVCLGAVLLARRKRKWHLLLQAVGAGLVGVALLVLNVPLNPLFGWVELGPGPGFPSWYGRTVYLLMKSTALGFLLFAIGYYAASRDDPGTQ